MRNADIKAVASEIPEYLRDIIEYAFKAAENNYRIYEESERSRYKITYSAYQAAVKALYNILYPMFAEPAVDADMTLRNWVFVLKAIEITIKYCVHHSDSDMDILEEYINNLSATMGQDIKFYKERY